MSSPHARRSSARDRSWRRIAATQAAAVAVAVLALFAAGCTLTWNPWIPGERSWNPNPVVDPSQLADQLPLDSRYVGDLGCYTRQCERRFRIVVEESGTLAVSLIPELRSDDEQVRMVLEGIGPGVLAQAGTGRGPRRDVPALGVSQPVHAGVYFVLVQSIGGPIPVQLTARLTPGAGPPEGPGPVAQAEPLAPSEGPPPKLIEVRTGRSDRAGYDPAVSFATLQTFRFPAPPPPQPGAPVEDALDRQIRRDLADELTRRGFRQASGGEDADLLVDFSRSAQNRSFDGIFSLYERYGFGISTDPFGDRVATRATLVVDIVDTRTNRIAWHAQSSRGIGPGVTPGAGAAAVARQAVSEALAGFPPQ